MPMVKGLPTRLFDLLEMMEGLGKTAMLLEAGFLFIGGRNVCVYSASLCDGFGIKIYLPVEGFGLSGCEKGLWWPFFLLLKLALWRFLIRVPNYRSAGCKWRDIGFLV